MGTKLKNANEERAIFNRLLLAHIFICSFGLLQLVAIAARMVSDAVFVPYNTLINYNYWAELSAPSLGKPAHILQYIFSVMALFACYGYFIILRDRLKVLRDSWLVNNLLGSTSRLAIYFFGIFVLNLIIFLNLSNQEIWIAGLSLTWFVAFVLPALPLIDQVFGSGQYNRLGRWGGWGLLSVVLGGVLWIFAPFVTGDMPVRNDYMDISSQTKLGDQYVDNTKYINQHALGGLNKYDPRTDQGASPAPRPGEAIQISNSLSLEKYLSMDDMKSKYAYDESRGVLIVKGNMSSDERDSFLLVAKNAEERTAINNVFFKRIERKSYSKENLEFLRKNQVELIDQATAGHYFHHHNAMYGPVNEYALGKPLAEISFLYGWFNAAIIMKLSSYLGGVTFDNYIRVSYAFYPLYFLFVLGVAAVIFKRLSYVLLVAITSAVFIHILGFEHIRFGPGLNPVRHLADVFVLAFFFWYLFSVRRKQLFLAIAFVFSVFGVLMNRELGMVLFVSFAVTVAIFIVRCSEDKRKDSAILAAASVAVVALSMIILGGTGENKTLIYSLLGVSVPETPKYLLFGLLVLISATYVFLLYGKRESDRRWRYLLFFWLAYAQGLLVYFVWNPAPNHFTSLGPIWALLGAMISKYALSGVQRNNGSKIIALPVVALALIGYIPTFSSYMKDQRSYFQEFEDHKVYQWSFPTAKIATTMDPIYFSDAIELIQKYEKSKGIYILSKYDNILPYLAGKYSAMPFVEVGLSLVTDREMKQAVDAISVNRPEFIFVDTDINRSYLGDVYDPNDKITRLLGTSLLSSGRAEILSNSQRLYSGIKDQYQMVDRGLLISVFKRKGVD
jgi:hypothetical protein